MYRVNVLQGLCYTGCMSVFKIVGIVSVVPLAGLIALILFGQHAEAPAPEAVSGTQTTPGMLRYLPLGDSYTIGQSVGADQRWPNQLTKKLENDNIHLKIVGNPAVTGYTSQDLIDRELPLVKTLQPDFVTVQIGVNDYVQRVSIQTFQKNLNQILDAVQKGIPQPTKIVLVTIPDYAKTPTGAQYGDPVAATAAIAAFNDIIKITGSARGLPVADVFGVSQKVVSDPSLTASDGLHPSGKQYALWTEEIFKTVTAAGTFK